MKGQTVVDPKGYLTELNSSTNPLASSNVGFVITTMLIQPSLMMASDVKQARALLTRLRESNPHHGLLFRSLAARGS